jgi:TonB family protein
MTPLKDTLEVSNPAAETSSSAAGERPKSESGGLRADAVSLEVPVKVHGSRLTEVVRGITPHTEPFEELSSTMIVFPQGGVLRMATPVTAGQMVVLTNMKSGHDAIGRVVKVRAYAQSQSYVEVEFTNRQPGYWGVKFAGDAAGPPRTILPAPPVSSVLDRESESAASHGSVPPPVAKRPEPPVFSSPTKAQSTPVPHVPHPQKESSFVGIGSQEEVQPAAAATTLRTPKIERVVAPAGTLSFSELRGDATAAAPPSMTLGAGVPGEMTDLSEALEETSHEIAPAPALATFAAASAAPAAIPAGPQKVFGARFDSLAPTLSEQASEAPASSNTNRFFIVTGIAALLVVGLGGAFYLHLLPGTRATQRRESAPPAVTLPPTTAPSSAAAPSASSTSVATGLGAAPGMQVPQPSLNQTPTAANAGVAMRTNEPAPVSANRPVVAERLQTSAAANQKPVKTMPDMLASLRAHPVAAQHAAADDAEPAPSVDAGLSASGDLQGITSASDVAPPPLPAAPAIKVGGDVQPPKLVSSVMPVYPSVARSAGVSGKVVVQASVSATGQVVATKVISGPVLLRPAAVDAVRRWKYQPATLNGTPVAVDITVTMTFHQ